MTAARRLVRVGLTMRVSTRFHGQPHDCLDQAWSDLLVPLGIDPVPLPNMAADRAVIADYLDALDLAGVILTGGNDIATGQAEAGSEISERRDAFERAVIDWAMDRNRPLLGVCRGMQFLNHVLGGLLERVEGHVATRHPVRLRRGVAGSAFGTLPPSFEVNSFHNFAVPAQGLASDLRAVAEDAEGRIEALTHTKSPVAAIMWHPEREAEPDEWDVALLRALFLPG